jgi:RNA polymerase sigma-70 factor (ECF subfamily)
LPERDTDERLVERAAGGSEEAFLLLYQRHRESIFRFAYRLLGSTELAEDVTHDCFLSLIGQSGRFDAGRGSLRTYLYGAARNLAMKRFRDLGRETAVDDWREEAGFQEKEGPLRRLLDRELAEIVQKAIASLPPLQRESLVLFEYENLALADIATIVGADVGTVKSRLHRAREQLRRRLAPYFKSDREVVAVENA